MANTGVVTIPTYIPELWSDLVQKATEANLVASKRFFDVSGYGEIKSKGDILHVPILSNISATTKTTNTELPSTATTESEVQITIDTHKGIRVVLEDIAKVQSSYDMMSLYTQKIGYGLAAALDTSLLSLYSGLAQTVGATTSSGAGMSDTNIVAGMRLLDVANAPQTDRSFIIDPYGIEDLRLVDKFTRYDAIGQADNANRIVGGMQSNGLFGSIYGVPVFVSTNVQTTSVVGGTLSRGLLCHKEAFAYGVQMDKKMEQWRNAPQLADEIIGQMLYGVKEYRDAFGVAFSYAQ
jgi:hypothetical protein